MRVFVEQVAVERAVTLSPGAVLGFVPGLLAHPRKLADDTGRSVPPLRLLVAIEAWPGQDGVSKGHK